MPATLVVAKIPPGSLPAALVTVVVVEAELASVLDIAVPRVSAVVELTARILPTDLLRVTVVVAVMVHLMSLGGVANCFATPMSGAAPGCRGAASRFDRI